MPCHRRINGVGSPAGKLPRGSGAAPVKTGGGNRATGAIICLWSNNLPVARLPPILARAREWFSWVTLATALRRATSVNPNKLTTIERTSLIHSTEQFLWRLNKFGAQEGITKQHLPRTNLLHQNQQGNKSAKTNIICPEQTHHIKTSNPHLSIQNVRPAGSFPQVVENSMRGFHPCKFVCKNAKLWKSACKTAQKWLKIGQNLAQKQLKPARINRKLTGKLSKLLMNLVVIIYEVTGVRMQYSAKIQWYLI